jgi:recombinational DNA repair protein (RecF pathway)
MSLITTDAIVLHAVPYLESSRILRLATREAGVWAVEVTSRRPVPRAKMQPCTRQRGPGPRHTRAA